MEPISNCEKMATIFKEDSKSILLLKEMLVSTSGEPIEYGRNYLIFSFYYFHVVRKIKYDKVYKSTLVYPLRQIDGRNVEHLIFNEYLLLSLRLVENVCIN